MNERRKNCLASRAAAASSFICAVHFPFFFLRLGGGFEPCVSLSSSPFELPVAFSSSCSGAVSPIPEVHFLCVVDTDTDTDVAIFEPRVLRVVRRSSDAELDPCWTEVDSAAAFNAASAACRRV